MKRIFTLIIVSVAITNLAFSQGTVNSVTSTTIDGTFKIGDVIHVDVNLSTAATVTGVPQIQLATAGSINQLVNYTSGSGTSTLRFDYTVQAGDVSADLNYLATNSLTLNGGTINKSTGGMGAITLTLPALASGSALAGSNAFVIDGVVPTLTLTQPASSASVNNAKVTYTISENLSSGTITWTRTGGTADGSSPHVQSLSGTELTANQTNHTLNSPPTLVDGAVYTVSFDGKDTAGSDGAGNPTPGNPAVTVSNTSVTYDVTAPVFSSTSPASSTSVNNTNVSYTLSEAIVSGTITWTRTGGTADGASPHAQALTGTELNTGAHNNITLTNNPTLVDGTIYTIAFNGTDAAGNTATTVSKTSVTYDVTNPVISSTAPATSALVNSSKVSYTLSEAIGSGTITWTRTGGTADGASPHIQALTGTELNTGAHSNITLTNNPTLVDGTIYTVAFDVTDLAGNVATTVTNTSVSYDFTVPAISTTAPATSANVNNTNVSYTLSEAVASGSITWTRTGGTADGASPHVQALTGAELNSGAHTNITLTNNPTLVSGTVYTVTFNATDASGNAATTITNTSVTFDTTPPTITATAPATNALKNNTQVSYTLSEAIGSGTITWTRTSGTADGASPHIQSLTGTELNTGAHSNITLTNNPTLVDGTVYTVTFDATDLAGNVATTVTNTNITFDGTPPVISATAPATNAKVNNTIVSYTLSETVVSGSITWTRTSGTADGSSPHVQALTGSELNSGAHTNVTLTNDPTLVNGTVYTITFNASDLVNAATTVTNTNVTFDTTPPTITATAPATSALKNNTQVSYTLSEAIGSGTITWTRTSGTADGASPHIQALTGTELNTGAHSNITLTNNPVLVDGTAYTVTFDATDLAGNAATTVTNTNITYDFTAPTITTTAPATNARVNNTKVSYTLSEAVASGSITWTRTSGTADGASPHAQALTGAELNSGAHTNITLTNNPTLVNGTVYTVTFNATDPSGNAATTVTNTNITFDTSPPTITATTPATNAYVNHTKVSYTLSEAIGSGTITWTRTSGTADGASPHIQALTGTELNTGAHSNITLTNNPTLVDGSVYTVTFNATDLAGNTATTVTNTSVTYDITPPTITLASFFSSFDPATDAGFTTCTGTAVNNTSSREYVHLTISEPLNLADGALITVGTPGFAASAGTFDVSCDSRGASVYHSGSGAVIHLFDNFVSTSPNVDGAWDGNTIFSFTSGGTNVKDLAGNEMGTVPVIVPGDNTPPGLATGMVFNPNGAGPETIVFTLDETLNAAVTNNVTGFTVSAPGLNTGLFNYNPATKTVTLTSTSNGQWTDAVTVSYDQATGNVTDPANNEMVAFGGAAPAPAEPIFLTSVHIQSNNGTNTAWATTGNTTTLTFTVARPLVSTPVVTFYGGTPATTVTGPVGSTYTATLTMTAGMTESVIPFQIDVAESIKTTTATATTDGSSVTFDKTAPTITPITIASNNANSTFAKVGDIITVSFTTSDNLGTVTATSATIDGFAATTSATTATLTTTASDNTGVMPFSITFSDQAGNTSTKTTTTNASSVTFDKTPPVASSIAISSALKGIGTTNGIVATSVDFLVTFTETNTPLSGIDATDFTVSTTGTVSYTAPLVVSVTSATTRTVTVNGITGYGEISLGLTDDNTILDAASNPLAGAGDGSIAPSFTGTQYYTMVLPGPAVEAVTVTSSNVTGNSIDVSWPGTNTAQIPTHFLVLAKPTTAGSYPSVADGTYVNDGALAQNVLWALGTNTWTFTGLNSGTSYDFIVYKYTLAPNNTNDNIDFETSTPGVLNGVATTTAALSTVVLNSTPVTIGSIKNSSGTSVNVMQFTIYDDGQDPISPNVMTLHPNYVAQESITFTLGDQLTLAEGATVTGFTSSTGTIATAVYTGKGTTNTITLTSQNNGDWNSSTTISYSETSGNVQFVTLGSMQSISSHAVAAVTDFVDAIHSTNGSYTYTVPAGVTKIVVEVQGAGGSGGGWDNIYGGGSQGGGGGAYSRSLLTVKPGDVYNLTVGAGGTSIAPNFSTCCNAGNKGGSSVFGSSLIIAEGGDGGESGTYFAFYGTSYPGTFSNGHFGKGGQAANGIGDVKFSGGNGGSGGGNLVSNSGTGPFPMSPNDAGGGGSSAGFTLNGNNGASAATGSCAGCVSAGGSAPSFGGSGGSGFQNSTGGTGVIGGGGGGTGAAFVSGTGGDGRIRIVRSNASAAGGTSDLTADNSPFKFSQIVITQGSANDPLLANWQDIIAGAELFDGTNTISGVDVDINPTNITFKNIPSTLNTDLGYITDANGSVSSKTYTLKVWLKNNLTNSLAATVDGLNLDFKIDAANASNLTYNDASNSNQKSSRILAAQPALESGASKITVDASQLVYHAPGSTSPTNTNPQTQIGVGVPFSANIAGQDPEVYALDTNNNLDLDYTTANGNNGTISNPLQGFGQSVSSLAFTNGKLSLNSLNFTSGSSTLLNTQIVVTGTGSPAVTAATSTNVWPVISSLTTISQGVVAPGSELASFPSTTNSLPASFNFDFTVTDDSGADPTGFTDNDGLPTIIPTITISQDSNNGTNGGGDVTTFDKWTLSIAGAQLSDGINTVNAATIADNSISFNLTAAMQTVPDGGSKTYQLRIWLKNPVDPSLLDILDHKDFAFSIDQTGLAPAITPNTSSTYAISSTNTGDSRNVVQVTATQIDFGTQWTAGANQNYDASLTPSPTASARDTNGNLDIDWNTSASITAAGSGTATYPVDTNPLGNPVVTSVSGGIITIDPTILVTSAGNGLDLATAKLTITSGLISSAGSGPGKTGNSFVLNFSHNSDIVQDNTFSYSTNILYATANNQQPSPLSNANGIALEQFLIRDGGASHSDADGSPTVLTSITLDVDNYQNLRELALFNGSANIKEISVIPANYTVVAGKARITFSGFTFTAAKNANAALTIKGSFNGSGVMDNQVISFAVVSVSASLTGSSKFANSSPTGIQSTVAGNQNKIEVVATQITYTTIPTSASINVPFAVTVQAQDAFGSLDADYNGTISSFSTTPGGPAFVTANDPSGAFTGGVLNFPGTFKFTTGNGNTQLVLNSGAANTAGASVDAGAIAGTSAVISILTSFESFITKDPTFTIPATIPYVTHQETSPNLTGSSYELIRVLLLDGSRSASSTYGGQPLQFQTLTNTDAQVHGDVDGADTYLGSITIQISNPSNLRTIGLFDKNGVQLGSQIDVAALNLISGAPPQNFTFTGSPLLTAADDSSAVFSIRASFNSTASTVSDGDDIQIQLISASTVVGAGSEFYNGTPANSGTGGPYPGGQVPGGFRPLGLIDVVATSLDFLTQPSTYAGLTPSPVGQDPLLSTTTAGVVTARDKFGLVDTNFITDIPSSVGITLTDGDANPITLPVGASFINGVLDLNGMIYNATGNGTVRVQTTNSSAVAPINTNLDSNNPINNTLGNSKPSTPVYVINTTVQYDATTTTLSASQDVTGQANLKGGKTGLSIFGLKFSATGTTGSEPYLKKFVIGFKTGIHSSAASAGKQWYYNSNTGVTVFNSSTLKILYNGVDISTKGGVITPQASTTAGEFDLINVDLTSFTNSHSLTGAAAPANIVLQVDVSSTTNGATQTLIPYLVDGGYGFASSDANITVSNGTAYSIGSIIGTPNITGNSHEIDGIEFNFASATPPKLLADISVYPTTLTKPFTPQSNVDPAYLAGTSLPSPKPQLVLQFDTNVGVLDDPTSAPTGSIYKRSNNTKVADLYFDTSVASGQVQATVAANGQTINNNAVYGKLVFNVCDPGNPNQLLSTPLNYDSVYYVTIVPGRYDQSSQKGAGIADLQLNFYGGVSDNSTLYFKTWSNTAPTVNNVTSPFNTTALGTISAIFSQFGTAYFAVVPHSPTNSASTYTGAQIKAGAVPGQVNSANSINITQLGQIVDLSNLGPFQIFQFAATFSTALDYDVFMYSENNSGVPIGSPVYYYNSLILGSSITDPATSTGGSVPNVPLYQVCPDSYMTLTQPMVVMENSSTTKGFLFKGTDQTVNILLPKGYEFDTKVTPLILLGPSTSDFTNLTGNPGAGTPLYTTYSSNTLLQLRFNNSAVLNFDVISISGLRVIGKRDPVTGTLPSQGDIVWFYGNDAITANPGNLVPLILATIRPYVPIKVPDFANSYWTFNNSISPYHTNFSSIITNSSAATYMSNRVNAIPDNYGAQVRLIPETNTFSIAEDFLASTFSGSGVTGDLLTLTGVAKDAPFNIVMNHTDINGCVFSQPEQYVVYTHSSPISDKLGVTGNINPATNLPFTKGTVQDIVNTNFNSAGNAGNASPIVSQPLTPSEKAGYTLLELQADLPVSEIALNATGASQLMSGPQWQSLIKSLPINQFSGSGPSSTFAQATWDYASILNAPSATVNSTPYNAPSKILASGSFTNVYDYFKQQSPTSGDYFWTGGSMGNIEYTAVYQNTADNSIFVPFRQVVELFVPAVPLIEVQSNNVFYDPADLNKAPTINNAQYPPSQTLPLFPNSGYQGTATFCEFGGQISLRAYPQASGGTSVGKFAIFDYATNTAIIAAPPAFIDNGNGTMTLDPKLVKNNYRDILVTYTYAENNSPAVGTGYLVIRVTPNPVAKFTQTSTLGPNAPNASTLSSYCVSNQIDFDATASTINGQSIGTNATYAWGFGDPNSPANSSVLANPLHVFTVSSTYPVALDLVSNFGCPSIPNASSTTPGSLVVAVTVGAIPIPDFGVVNNCVGDQISFDASASKMPLGGNNSSISTYNWDYNYQVPSNPLPAPTPATSSLANATGAQTKYSLPGFYNVHLTTISSLGCQNSITKPISQLPVVSAFNNNFDQNDGSWQSLDLSTTPPSPGVNNPNSSWIWGATSSRTNAAFNSSNTNQLWSTAALRNTTIGSYNPKEKSALYSGCLDLNPLTVPRPMISYSSFVDVNTGDGLVLQYSKDNLNIMDPNKTWSNLGSIPTGNSPGLDWYNAVALPSNPGNTGPTSPNSIGTGWTTILATAKKWIHPKHTLDAVAASAGSQKVILRFALSSVASNTADLDGVAIDSVFFGSRTRTILFENFTTTDGGTNAPLNAAIRSDNNAIKAFVQKNISTTQLVDINYHIGFVGQDPFNIDNSSDPGARALFYGVRKVPYAYLDGRHYQDLTKINNIDSADLFKNWGQAEYDLNTLQLAKADFNNLVTVNPDGSLKIDVNFTPLFDLPSGIGGTTLQVAVLEKVITSAPTYGKITTGETSFEYVLKKILPSAVGTQFTNPIKATVPVSGGTFKYVPQNLHSNVLTVVVFLQNETTKEVYQADLIDDLTINPSVTGIEPLSAENIKLYPNPADRELTIELPSPVKESTTLRMANQLGQFLELDAFAEGERTKTISTYGLPEGVYILQIGGNNSAVRTKVVVLHK